MNTIKEIKLDQTNWLEVTFIDENDKEIHCESFGDSDEYQVLVLQRCNELNVVVTKELETILLEQKNKRKVFTPEELAEIAKLDKISANNSSIQEAKNYLTSTDFYMTVDKYASLTTERQVELTTKRAEARELINTLEAELILLQGVE